MNFVHLHVHSYFSFYDSTASVESLVREAKSFGMPALALTDYNGIYGAVRFIRAAREYGIKPVIGAEVLVEHNGKMIFLVRSREGYSNLCRILTDALVRGSQHPVVRPEILQEHGRGLFVLLRDPLATQLSLGKEREALDLVSWLQEIFDRQSVIVELQDHRLPGDQEEKKALWNFAIRSKLPAVAANNIHLLCREDYDLHEVLIKAARIVHHRDVRPRKNPEFYLKSPQEMESLFRGFEDAVANTEMVAEECNLDLPLGGIRPPEMGPVDGLPAGEFLRRACFKALGKKYGQIQTHIAERLDSELRIIEEKGFSNYFLLVNDIIRFAGEKGIRCSCRGSAAGSLVAYLLGISTVDPIENGLLFERFLNPERPDIPDIDIDLDSKRRDEVIDYVISKYPGHAAMVATVSCFQAKSAIREIGRVFGLDYGKIERLAGILRPLPASQIKEAVTALPEFRDSEISDPGYRKILDIVSRVDGFPRHISVHLGGVVVSKEPLFHFSPVQLSRKGWPVLSFDKDDAEALGLIKTDLLGLRMLAAIQEAADLLEAQGKEIRINDFQDKNVYKFLQRAETIGCFQVESPGMRSLLGQLKPDRFSDIIACISLFRPGPVQADMMTPYLARRKLGTDTVFYLDSSLEPVLSETYGVVLFQEQVLRIAHEIAGFSLGKADLMRRAMGDPDSDEMKAFKQDFFDGAFKKGIDPTTTGKIFELIGSLAAFGFNKAHACSFAKIAYESAWFKVYHPAEYMIGVLNNLPGMYPERVLLHEARRFGVKIIPPDINLSQAGYSLEDGSIRVGLKGIRNMGPKNLERILEEKSKRPFGNLEDFTERASVKASLLRSMIIAGLFDSLGPSRKMLLGIVDRRPVEKGDEFPLPEKVTGELYHSGLDLSAHFMSLYRQQLDGLGVAINAELPFCSDGEKVAVCGIKAIVNTPPTRSGIRVIFLTLEDETGVCDVAVFPSAQEKFASTVFKAGILFVEGVVRRLGDSVSVNAECVMSLKDALCGKECSVRLAA